MKKLFLAMVAVAAMLSSCSGGKSTVITTLDKHPFAYVGEWDTRNPDKQTLFVVKDGKVDWEYSIPMHDEWDRILEFDDVTVLPNGNIVFAAMSKLGIVTPDKELVWEFICPPGTESHSCQPIDEEHVVFALNGNPGKIMIWNVKTDTMVKEIVVPTAGTNTHGQFRHVRMTKEGTFVTGLIPEGLAVELNGDGEIIWSTPAPSAWSVIKLHNGNYLIGGDSRSYVREVNAAGEVVWEITQEDVPFKLYNTQTALRLNNGNTIITNWVAGEPVEEWAGSVQFFEVTPEKEIVWQVSSWENPDLGPCTYLHILDEKGDVYFGLQR